MKKSEEITKHQRKILEYVNDKKTNNEFFLLDDLVKRFSAKSIKLLCHKKLLDITNHDTNVTQKGQLIVYNITDYDYLQLRQEQELIDELRAEQFFSMLFPPKPKLSRKKV